MGGLLWLGGMGADPAFHGEGSAPFFVCGVLLHVFSFGLVVASATSLPSHSVCVSFCSLRPESGPGGLTC